MIEYRTLVEEDFPRLHTAFSEAFSDYVIPFAIAPDQLRAMLRRRGWLPALSAAAFDGERMVAFTANALDGSRAYDSGTGVVPSHRRNGLAARLMQMSCDLLRSGGAASYVLEVIETNTAAMALYEREGFVKTRRLQCWSYSGPDEDHRSSRKSRQLPPDHEVDALADIVPSWQNSMTSLRRASEESLTLRDSAAVAVLFPATGDLPFLGVDRNARRRGHGRRMLARAASVAARPLRILNVDDGAAGIAAFLESCGATRTVGQFEMVRGL